jgi:NAD(P)-dependent dehydrogenase (short-subunit alcohol dehydrogenase family)
MGSERQIALVTGASSGIGRATAVKLVEQGFQVIAAARRMERLEQLANEVEGIIPRQVDLSDPEDVEKFFVDATVPGPDLIGDIIVEAVLSDNPKPVYSGGFMSEAWLSARADMDDAAFDRYLAEMTGLADLKV